MSRPPWRSGSGLSCCVYGCTPARGRLVVIWMWCHTMQRYTRQLHTTCTVNASSHSQPSWHSSCHDVDTGWSLVTITLYHFNGCCYVLRVARLSPKVWVAGEDYLVLCMQSYCSDFKCMMYDVWNYCLSLLGYSGIQPTYTENTAFQTILVYTAH